MGRRGKGKAVKKNQHRPAHGDEGDDMVKAPHSFVVPLGKPGKCVRELAADFRSVNEIFLLFEESIIFQYVVKPFCSEVHYLAFYFYGKICEM